MKECCFCVLCERSYSKSSADYNDTHSQHHIYLDSPFSLAQLIFCHQMSSEKYFVCK